MTWGARRHHRSRRNHRALIMNVFFAIADRRATKCRCPLVAIARCIFTLFSDVLFISKAMRPRRTAAIN